jgi:hypothetical protein
VVVLEVNQSDVSLVWYEPSSVSFPRLYTDRVLNQNGFFDNAWYQE